MAARLCGRITPYQKHKDAQPCLKTFEDTALFKKFKAAPSVPDPLADKVQAQAAFDEVLAPLGVRAPPPEAKESEAQYLARLGEHAAAFGPEERKSVNRYNLPAAVLAEFVREDLNIAKAEVERPHYSLKEGVLTERHRQDASGRRSLSSIASLDHHFG